MIDRIIIVGDSWGCGEWVHPGEISHSGLEQYLLDDGYNVINKSQPSADSNLIINQIPRYLTDKDLLVIFTTDFQRGQYDWDVLKDYSVEQFLEHKQTHKNIWLEELRKNLKKKKARIILLGALGTYDINDRLDYHSYWEIIPNLMSWWLPNNNLVLEYQTYAIGLPLKQLVHTFKRNRNKELLSHIWAQHKLWKEFATESLFPDGAHPSRDCHNKLYKYIKEKYL